MRTGEGMERRVALSLLTDFYGPLLTEHRRRVMRMYCDEDLTFQEIAEQLGISRQGVHEAVKAAGAQLDRFEETLGLVGRDRALRREVAICRERLASVRALPDSAGALKAAIEALARIEWIEE